MVAERLGHTPDTAFTLGRYVASSSARAFGDRLGEVRAEMEALAAKFPSEELNRVGFPLYEKFRPEVPRGAEGWGAKGVLHLDRIRAAVSIRRF